MNNKNWNDDLRDCDERCVLTVYSTFTKNGKSAFRYDLPDKEKLFNLIGFMEVIKLDLIDYSNENPENEE